MKHTAAFKLQCMEFSTDINNEKIDLCFYEDGHKVSDFSLTQDEAITLAKELVKSIAKQCGCRELAFTAYKINGI